MSYSDSLDLLLALNGIGAIGRILPNYLGDIFGTINVFIPTTAIASIIMFCWIPVSSTGGLYAWAIFYGFAIAGAQALFPAVVSSLTKDPQKQGTRLGMAFTIVSFASLTGSPIAGAIIAAGDGDFLGAQLFAGCSLIAASLSLTVCRAIRLKRKGSNFWDRVRV